MADNITGKYLDYEGLKEVFRLIKEFKGGDENNTSCECPEKLEEIEKRLAALEAEVGALDSNCVLAGEFYDGLSEDQMYCYINGAKIPLTQKFAMTWEEICEYLPEDKQDGYHYGQFENQEEIVGDFMGGFSNLKTDNKVKISTLASKPIAVNSEVMPIDNDYSGIVDEAVLFPPFIMSLKKLYRFPNLTTAETMVGSFLYMVGLQEIDSSNWDMSNLDNLSMLFALCAKLTDVEMSTWNVSKVKSMAGMFAFCSSLTKYDFGKWDVSNVVDMSHMFMSSGIETLKNIKPDEYDIEAELMGIEGWSPNSLQKAEGMFSTCKNLKDASALGNVTLPSLTEANRMFEGCTSLTTMPILNMPALENGESMFADCVNLTDVSAMGKIDFPETANIYRMFEGCSSIKDAHFPKNYVNSISNLYQYCDNIETVNVHGYFKGIKNTCDISTIIPNAKTIKAIYGDTVTLDDQDGIDNGWQFGDLDNSIDSNGEINFSKAFSGNTKLQEVPTIVSFLPISSANNAFTGCDSLKNIQMVLFAKKNNCTSEFKDCTSLQKAEIYTFNSLTGSCESMFENCYSLRDFAFKGLDNSFSDVTSTKAMFKDCESLKELDLSFLKSENKISDMTDMFNGCYNLRSLNLGQFNPEQLGGLDAFNPTGNYGGMFKGCENLYSITCTQTFRDWLWSLNTDSRSKLNGVYTVKVPSGTHSTIPANSNTGGIGDVTGYIYIRASKGDENLTESIQTQRISANNYGTTTINGLTTSEFFIVNDNGNLSATRVYVNKYQIDMEGNQKPYSSTSVYCRVFTTDDKTPERQVTVSEVGTFNGYIDIDPTVTKLEFSDGHYCVNTVQVVDANDSTPRLIVDVERQNMVYSNNGSGGSRYIQYQSDPEAHFAIVVNGKIQNEGWDFSVSSSKFYLNGDFGYGSNYSEYTFKPSSDLPRQLWQDGDCQWNLI